MPRRKRKSSFQTKPSLVFTESPVNIVNNVPSPVMCARYPATATSVPVEELEELAWVSPQFSRVPSTGHCFGKRRPPKHRKQNATTGIHDKENTIHRSHHVGRRKVKYTSLKFIGEKTIEESKAEEVNISCDSTSQTDGESGNDARISEQDSPANVDATQNTRGSGRRIKRKRFSERLANINFLMDDAVQTSRTIENNKNNSTQDEYSDSELNSTKLKPCAKMKSPVKRLFQSQIGSCDIGSDIELIDNNDIMSTIPTVPDTANTADEVIKETDSSSNCLSDIGHDQNSDNDLDIQKTSTPVGVRRSLRIRMLRKMFEHGASPDKDSDTKLKVIVPDTPESNYGWPLKKYQIMKYKLNKR